MQPSDVFFFFLQFEQRLYKNERGLFVKSTRNDVRGHKQDTSKELDPEL